jgi:hypothetical protein
MTVALSYRQKLSNALKLAQIEGVPLSSRHRKQAGLESESLSISPCQPPCRKAPPPISRKYSPEQANLIRLHKQQFGIGYRTLAAMHHSCLGSVHHAVTKRGAYKHD